MLTFADRSSKGPTGIGCAAGRGIAHSPVPIRRDQATCPRPLPETQKFVHIPSSSISIAVFYSIPTGFFGALDGRNYFYSFVLPWFRPCVSVCWIHISYRCFEQRGAHCNSFFASALCFINPLALTSDEGVGDGREDWGI